MALYVVKSYGQDNFGIQEIFFILNGLVWVIGVLIVISIFIPVKVCYLANHGWI